jgi:hypothetical protein
LGELPELDFTREPDPITTYRELRVRRAGKTPKP